MTDIYFVNEVGGFLGWVHRGGKVLAVAHMDFIGSGVVHKNNHKKVVSSALDDRLGVYAAMEVLPAMGVECDVLLCDDEESANSSMQSIGMRFLQKYNWIIELDCAGVQAITYNYKSMEGALSTVWDRVHRGAFSDITSVEHVCPIGAFNAGVGYHAQHTESCYVNIEEFLQAMSKVKKFYDMYEDVKFIEEDNLDSDGAPHENMAMYWNEDYAANDSFYWQGNKDYQEYLRRRPTDHDDPADKFIHYNREQFLRGDGAPIDDNEGELECCEMCARVLMNDEVFLYQGFPVCEEHYYMLTAENIDAGNVLEDVDNE
jgi:hypothetical protein